MMSPAGLARNLEAGMIWVNSENNRHLPAPFGGMKSSGIGRDGGDFELTDEEQAALRAPDIGLLYVMGVNGQILMHYAALRGFEWDTYIQAMRDGLEAHGPVRSGLYLTTDGKGAV